MYWSQLRQCLLTRPSRGPTGPQALEQEVPDIELEAMMLAEEPEEVQRRDGKALADRLKVLYDHGFVELKPTLERATEMGSQ